MANCYIYFSCKQQELDFALGTVAEGANVIHARFSLCEKWSGLTVYARFKHQAAVYDVPLDGENCALIPWEVVKYTGFEVSLYGEKPDGSRLTSESVFVPVKRSIDADSVAPLPHTPSMVELFLNRAASAETAAHEAAESAEAAETAAHEAAESAASANATIGDVDARVQEVEVLAGEIAEEVFEIKEVMPTKTSDLENDANYASKEWTLEQIPTKVSAFENDANYASTDWVNGKNYATDADLQETQLFAELVARQVSEIKDGMPTVPTKVSAFTNDAGYLTAVPSEYVTETELSGKKYITQNALSGYATQSWVNEQMPTKVSAFENDANYASYDWVNSKNFATKADIQSYIDSAILGGAW